MQLEASWPVLTWMPRRMERWCSWFVTCSIVCKVLFKKTQQKRENNAVHSSHLELEKIFHCEEVENSTVNPEQWSGCSTLQYSRVYSTVLYATIHFITVQICMYITVQYYNCTGTTIVWPQQTVRSSCWSSMFNVIRPEPTQILELTLHIRDTC